MADITYNVNGNNYNIEDTINLNVGDYLNITGTLVGNIGFAVYSTGDWSSSIEGNLPPEIAKNDTYWRDVGRITHIWLLKNKVRLNTPGTYNVRKAIEYPSGKSAGAYLTIVVVGAQPTSPAIPVNVSGTWKDSTPSVNVNGSWKEVSNAYVNVNGSWKEI